MLQTNDFSFYWYYLSDAQKKTGDLEQSLNSIDKALTFHLPYPSRELLLNKQQQVAKLLSDASSNNKVVIDQKSGDVTGDGFINTVYLTGEKTEGSPFWKNISLEIINEKTNMYEIIPLKENAGYNPTIFLGDFTGDRVDDILIVIDTGGSGGTIYAYVFSFIEGSMRQIFDADEYNERTKYEVNYQNQYKVTVLSSDPKKKYLLDLMYKGQEYLSEIYNENGTLKQPIKGWVDPIGGLYPIDFARDGNYELMAIQEIAGRYHADGLGYVENVLKWNVHAFVTDRQNVSIFGEDLPS
ncbi:VCBS repeat-containing protein [Psychrobacillus glaciei]|uniref:VCBS repeat-containing protein n=1 Tax=Psychrobacillus glaciei TaxID=2283160 RepID=A0A5J6SU27_9BACI|nr:VCBS repeat-containing protein [Psychrobacillus glaciei]